MDDNKMKSYGVQNEEHADVLRSGLYELIECGASFEDVEDYLLDEGVELDALEHLLF